MIALPGRALEGVDLLVAEGDNALGAAAWNVHLVHRQAGEDALQNQPSEERANVIVVIPHGVLVKLFAEPRLAPAPAWLQMAFLEVDHELAQVKRAAVTQASLLQKPDEVIHHHAPRGKRAAGMLPAAAVQQPAFLQVGQVGHGHWDGFIRGLTEDFNRHLADARGWGSGAVPRGGFSPTMCYF